jgi:hypothetical protein
MDILRQAIEQHIVACDEAGRYDDSDELWAILAKHDLDRDMGR